jgi:hypothetical protein
MRIPAIVGTLALLALGGCQPNIPAVTWVTPLSRRLDDQVIARDRARFDSVGRAFAAADVATAQQEFDRDRAVMLIGLADEAYQRNEDA